MTIRAIFFLIFAFTLPGHSSPVQNIIGETAESENSILFPRVKDAALYQDQANYYFELLKLALERADVNYKIEIVPIPTMAQSRSLLNVEQGVYDLHWGVTSTEREQSLLPIRIPLLRGLLGLRIPLVNERSKRLLEKVIQLSDFKNVYFGQGHDWIDTQIFKQHGLRVIEASNTKALHELLNKDRIDALPRSILEVWYEQKHMQHTNVFVDQHIAFFYPLPTYFFVRKGEDEIHQQLTIGLKRAIEDGTFLYLFNKYFEDDIQRANLKNRRLFRLNNPFLPALTPLDDSALWFDFPIND